MNVGVLRGRLVARAVGLAALGRAHRGRPAPARTRAGRRSTSTASSPRGSRQRDLAAVFVAVHGAGGDDGGGPGPARRLRRALHRLGAGCRGDRVRQAPDQAPARGRPGSRRRRSSRSRAMRCATSGCSTSLPRPARVDLGPRSSSSRRGAARALGIRLARDADEVSVALLGGARLRPRGDHRALRRRPRPRRLADRARRRRSSRCRSSRRARASASFYDFEARYTPGATVFDAPADLAPEAALEAQRLAVAACELLGLRGPGPHRPDARRRWRAVAARGERRAGHDRHEPAAARRGGRRAWASTSSSRPSSGASL